MVEHSPQLCGEALVLGMVFVCIADSTTCPSIGVTHNASSHLAGHWAFATQAHPVAPGGASWAAIAAKGRRAQGACHRLGQEWCKPLAVQHNKHL